jgi:hypothetical protein
MFFIFTTIKIISKDLIRNMVSVTRKLFVTCIFLALLIFTNNSCKRQDVDAQPSLELQIPGEYII